MRDPAYQPAHSERFAPGSKPPLGKEPVPVPRTSWGTSGPHFNAGVSPNGDLIVGPQRTAAARAHSRSQPDPGTRGKGVSKQGAGLTGREGNGQRIPAGGGH